MKGFLHIRQKRHFWNKIKRCQRKRKHRLVGGRMAWMEGQDETNDTKIFRNKIKAGSVFLRSSTAHHHPDEFCHEREGETRHQSGAGTNWMDRVSQRGSELSPRRLWQRTKNLEWVRIISSTHHLAYSTFSKSFLNEFTKLVNGIIFSFIHLAVTCSMTQWVSDSSWLNQLLLELNQTSSGMWKLL